MKLTNVKLNIFIRLLIGLIFIVSSIFKLNSIDSFEIYIYSFGALNLSFSFILARLIISFEFFIGILMIIGSYLRKVILASIIILGIFSVFIIFLLVTNNEEHCHCFGDVIEISHVNSLIKNIALMFFLLLIYQSQEIKLKYRTHLLIFSFIFSITFPMIISPPDSFEYNKNSNILSYNEFILNKYLNEHEEIKEGKQVLCFFGTNCRFCKLAAQKLSVIAVKSKKTDLFKYVFWGTNESVDIFFKETNSYEFKYSILHQETFLRLTNGEMPLIILLENGLTKGEYDYRSINEQEFISFLEDK